MTRAAASAAPAVRLLAVVGLLLGPELALHRPLRHKSDSLGAPASVGRRGATATAPTEPPMRTAWLLCEGKVLASLEVAESLLRPHPGTARAVRTTRGDAVPPRPGRSTPSGMRFALDVAFFDRDSWSSTRSALGPERVALPRRRARNVLEAPAGSFERWGLEAATRLEIRETALTATGRGGAGGHPDRQPGGPLPAGRGRPGRGRRHLLRGHPAHPGPADRGRGRRRRPAGVAPRAQRERPGRRGARLGGARARRSRW